MASEGTTTDASAADQLASLNLSGAEGTEETAEPNEDPDLWKPHSSTEECPVCLVSLPLSGGQGMYWCCCGKTVCNACQAETGRALTITNRKRIAKKLPPMGPTCAFCRVPAPENDLEDITRCEQRVEKGDVEAMVNLADWFRTEEHGLARDEAKTLELYQMAAGLGCAKAFRTIGCCFFDGALGLIRDTEKGRMYLQDSAKKGDVYARFCLGLLEEDYQRFDTAIRHFKLAAAAGDEESMKDLWKYFPSKLDKAELEETLRAHKEACDEMKSEERERLIAYNEAKAGTDSKLTQIYEHYYDGVISAKDLKKALKAYQSGDVGQAVSILLKGRRACGLPVNV